MYVRVWIIRALAYPVWVDGPQNWNGIYSVASYFTWQHMTSWLIDTMGSI